VNTVSAESIGSPQLVRTVDAAWTSLPPRQRASAVIFTSNYGEASAIHELGPGTGLPPAASGHDTYWLWGPGNPHAITVVAVMPGPVHGAGDAAYLRQLVISVRTVATLSNPYGIHNQEFGGHVYLCTGPVTLEPDVATAAQLQLTAAEKADIGEPAMALRTARERRRDGGGGRDRPGDRALFPRRA
jgi:hypothetical protein